MRVGIEIGGTFTDLIATDGSVVKTAKVPSVAARPEEGAFAALAAAQIQLSEVTDLVHGSTVATNAVLERKGGVTGLVVTAGFRDIMLIQRQDRSEIYRLDYRKPSPVLPRANVFEAPERVLANGAVQRSLDIDAFQDALFAFIERRRIESLAICLLNSYANPAHEIAISKAVRARYPQIQVTCSCEISREFREYERASTTVLAAYVRPVIDSYISRFESALAEGGFTGRFSIMQSNGGRLPVPAIRRNPITALFSGPAAGVTGAIRQLEAEGYKNLITLDMGGTSTDVCVVTNSKPSFSSETQIDGLPIRTPIIDIATVGAGGGSIVWCDDAGVLHVGPQSSAAYPGPACYGRGGKQPTITDAHLIRGTLQAESFLGGRMKLDLKAAETAFQPLAEKFNMSLPEIADSAVRIADSNVVRAIQLISTELGHDPRDYVLVPFGGAGPLHAGRVAEELGIKTIVVPRNAGILSAFGLLASDFTLFESITRRTALAEAAMPQIKSSFAELERNVQAKFDQYGLVEQILYCKTISMRFVGQAFELEIDLPEDLSRLTISDIRDRFDATHRQVYFHSGGSHVNRDLEIVGYRVGGSISQTAIGLPAQAPSETGKLRSVQIYESGETHTAQVLTQSCLDGAYEVVGPALRDDGVSTTFVVPGWTAQSDASANLVIAAGS